MPGQPKPFDSSSHLTANSVLTGMGTPAKSGRIWSSPNSRSARRGCANSAAEGYGGGDEAMITALLQESGPAEVRRYGGGNGGGDGGGRRNLQATIMQEHVKDMETKMKVMQDEIDKLQKENMELKNHSNHKNKEKWGGGEKGKWGEGGWWANDPWKNWNGGDATTEADDTWVNDDGKGEQKLERDGKGDRATRVWWAEATTDAKKWSQEVSIEMRSGRILKRRWRTS